MTDNPPLVLNFTGTGYVFGTLNTKRQNEEQSKSILHMFPRDVARRPESGIFGTKDDEYYKKKINEDYPIHYLDCNRFNLPAQQGFSPERDFILLTSKEVSLNNMIYSNNIINRAMVMRINELYNENLHLKQELINLKRLYTQHNVAHEFVEQTTGMVAGAIQGFTEAKNPQPQFNLNNKPEEKKQ